MTSDRPVALFVLGFARSGTSALTRLLTLCGAAIPPRMQGGSWEPRPAVHLNGAILRRHDSAGFDPTLRLQEGDAFAPGEKAACIAKIRAYLETLPAAPVVVIKDPKITVLSELWLEAARQAGFDPAAVIAVRHPGESGNSVTASAGTSPEFGGALWLKYSLLAERSSRGMPRVFVEYANFMDNWRNEIKRISAALALDLEAVDEGAVDEYLSPSWRHHRECGPVDEVFGADWISTVYGVLSAAARDEPWDQGTLDVVFDQYRTSEHGFRAVFEDYHRLHRLYRLIPMWLVKLLIEARAIVDRPHRTWA